MKTKTLRWPFGNTLEMAIPLEREILTPEGKVTEDFVPGENDSIRVRLRGKRNDMEFTPRVEGNTLIVHDDGTLRPDMYAVEITIRKNDGSGLRSMWKNQVEIVCSNEGVLEEWNEFIGPHSQRLDAAVFFYVRGDYYSKEEVDNRILPYMERLELQYGQLYTSTNEVFCKEVTMALPTSKKYAFLMLPFPVEVNGSLAGGKRIIGVKANYSPLKDSNTTIVPAYTPIFYNAGNYDYSITAHNVVVQPGGTHSCPLADGWMAYVSTMEITAENLTGHAPNKCFVQDTTSLTRMDENTAEPFQVVFTKSAGSSEITDGSITEAKLADAAVIGSKIATGAVRTSHLAYGAVTMDKIEDCSRLCLMNGIEMDMDDAELDTTQCTFLTSPAIRVKKGQTLVVATDPELGFNLKIYSFHKKMDGNYRDNLLRGVQLSMNDEFYTRWMVADRDCEVRACTPAPLGNMCVYVWLFDCALTSAELDEDGNMMVSAADTRPATTDAVARMGQDLYGEKHRQLLSQVLRKTKLAVYDQTWCVPVDGDEEEDPTLWRVTVPEGIDARINIGHHLMVRYTSSLGEAGGSVTLTDNHGEHVLTSGKRSQWMARTGMVMDVDTSGCRGTWNLNIYEVGIPEGRTTMSMATKNHAEKVRGRRHGTGEIRPVVARPIPLFPKEGTVYWYAQSPLLRMTVDTIRVLKQLIGYRNQAEGEKLWWADIDVANSTFLHLDEDFDEEILDLKPTFPVRLHETEWLSLVQQERRTADITVVNYREEKLRSILERFLEEEWFPDLNSEYPPLHQLLEEAGLRIEWRYNIGGDGVMHAAPAVRATASPYLFIEHGHLVCRKSPTDETLGIPNRTVCRRLVRSCKRYWDVLEGRMRYSPGVKTFLRWCKVNQENVNHALCRFYARHRRRVSETYRELGLRFSSFSDRMLKQPYGHGTVHGETAEACIYAHVLDGEGMLTLYLWECICNSDEKIPVRLWADDTEVLPDDEILATPEIIGGASGCEVRLDLKGVMEQTGHTYTEYGIYHIQLPEIEVTRCGYRTVRPDLYIVRMEDAAQME